MKKIKAKFNQNRFGEKQKFNNRGNNHSDFSPKRCSDAEEVKYEKGVQCPLGELFSFIADNEAQKIPKWKVGKTRNLCNLAPLVLIESKWGQQLH